MIILQEEREKPEKPDGLLPLPPPHYTRIPTLQNTNLHLHHGLPYLPPSIPYMLPNLNPTIIFPKPSSFVVPPTAPSVYSTEPDVGGFVAPFAHLSHHPQVHVPQHIHPFHLSHQVDPYHTITQNPQHVPFNLLHTHPPPTYNMNMFMLYNPPPPSIPTIETTTATGYPTTGFGAGSPYSPASESPSPRGLIRFIFNC